MAKVYGDPFDARFMHNPCTGHMLRKRVGIESLTRAAGPGVGGLLLLLAGPAAAQDIAFAPEATEGCVAAAGDVAGREACVGRSADACMATPDGATTVGMGFCLDAGVAVLGRAAECGLWRADAAGGGGGGGAGGARLGGAVAGGGAEGDAAGVGCRTGTRLAPMRRASGAAGPGRGRRRPGA